MGNPVSEHRDPAEVARLEMVGGMFESITKRRREIASEMNSPGGISLLPRESLLDMLSILAFERNATQRSFLKEFYGGEDDRAKMMKKALIDRLYSVHGCDPSEVHGAVGRGCGLMNGYLPAQQVWPGGTRSKDADQA